MNTNSLLFNKMNRNLTDIKLSTFPYSKGNTYIWTLDAMGENLKKKLSQSVEILTILPDSNVTQRFNSFNFFWFSIQSCCSFVYLVCLFWGLISHSKKFYSFVEKCRLWWRLFLLDYYSPIIIWRGMCFCSLIYHVQRGFPVFTTFAAMKYLVSWIEKSENFPGWYVQICYFHRVKIQKDCGITQCITCSV